jgi:glucose-1-phosphate adenylyltransferase
VARRCRAPSTRAASASASSGTWAGCTTPCVLRARTRCTAATTTTRSPSGCCTRSPRTSCCRSRTTRWCTARARCSARCPATTGSASPTCARSTRGCGRTRGKKLLFMGGEFGQATGTPPVVAIANFTPVPREGYADRPAVPGRWREIAQHRLPRSTAAPTAGTPGRPCAAGGEPRPPLLRDGLAAAAGDGLARPRRPREPQPRRARMEQGDLLHAAGALEAMAYVLAGGRGSRLMELTDRRAKPAVYFGGKSRIIDFALSNALNSGIRRIAVATQYKAHSLIRHLQRGWNFLRRSATRASTSCRRAARERGQVVRGHRRRRVPEHRHHRRLRPRVPRHPRRRPRLQDGLRAHARAARQQRRRRHRRVRRGAGRMEATGFGIMHVDEQDRIVDFVEKPEHPPEMPDKPGLGAGEHGHLRLPARVPERAAPARRRRPGLEPRLRQGHHPLPRGTARRWRTASPTRACAAAPRTEAYWRDVGTLDAYWEANIDLTDVVPALDLYDKQLADLDLRRDHATGQVRARPRRPARRGALVARLGRLHRLRLHVRARCCSPASTCIRTGNVENAVSCPTSTSGGRAAHQRGRRRRRAHPEGLIVGEDPVLDAARFRRSERRRLPHHAADDRPARRLMPTARASSPSRRRSTRSSRPAGSPTSSVRCRRRSRARASSVRTLVPGYPAVLAAMRDARRGPRVPRPAWRPRALLAGARRRPRPRAIDAPHLYRRTGNPYLGPRRATGATTRSASPRSRASRPTIGRGLLPDSVPDVVHAHDWQAGSLPAYLTTADGPRPATVMTVHNLAFQGQFPADLLGDHWDCRHTRSHVDGVEYYGTHRLPQGRPRARRPHHDRVADLCRRDPHARTYGGMGLDGLLRDRGGRGLGHPQRHRRRRLESGARRRTCAATLRRQAPRPRAIEQGRAAGAASGSTPERRRRSSSASSAGSRWQKGMDLC